MKPFQLSLLRIAAAGLMLAVPGACFSKKDDPQAAPGMSWTADGTPASDPAPQVLASSTNIDIVGSTGTAPNKTTIHVSMPAQLGSYAINSTNTVAADYILHGGTATVGYQASTGTVTVSTLTTTRVMGSFSFTAYNYSSGVSSPLVKTITNGQFEVAR
ncbi:hypothetical protein ACVWYF_000907 [Hymenobacter sp. UYAg731]